ncbi:MAG: hypothetical protein EKK31_29805 [Hyphomicrobiales bacterium]|nr:MAG: hypothetical protein EKK31_29805 [Hyphomicrobiales bacterium]
MIGDAMGASLLEAFDFELKHAIGRSGGSGGGVLRRIRSRWEDTALLGLEIATALGFNARHV